MKIFGPPKKVVFTCSQFSRSWNHINSHGMHVNVMFLCEPYSKPCRVHPLFPWLPMLSWLLPPFLPISSACTHLAERVHNAMWAAWSYRSRQYPWGYPRIPDQASKHVQPANGLTKSHAGLTNQALRTKAIPVSQGGFSPMCLITCRSCMRPSLLPAQD